MFYCRCCGRERNGRQESIAYWQPKLPDAFLFPKQMKKSNAVCEYCCKKLRDPYLIHDRKSSEDLRVVHLSSRSIFAPSESVQGLIALDFIPNNIAFPYCGFLVDEFTLAAVEMECGIFMDRSYAKGGPKGRGVSTILFGQLAASFPYSCAHFVNCVYKTKIKSNAAWGTLLVDADFLERYPDLDARLGEKFPAVRTTRDIDPGSEILLNSYGSSYWIHHNKSKNNNHARLTITQQIFWIAL